MDSTFPDKENATDADISMIIDTDHINMHSPESGDSDSSIASTVSATNLVPVHYREDWPAPLIIVPEVWDVGSI